MLSSLKKESISILKLLMQTALTTPVIYLAEDIIGAGLKIINAKVAQKLFDWFYNREGVHKYVLLEQQPKMKAMEFFFEEEKAAFKYMPHGYFIENHLGQYKKFLHMHDNFVEHSMSFVTKFRISPDEGTIAAKISDLSSAGHMMANIIDATYVWVEIFSEEKNSAQISAEAMQQIDDSFNFCLNWYGAAFIGAYNYFETPDELIINHPVIINNQTCSDEL